ncbi:aminodeoxychorismate lyase [Natronospira bacteriovora]|uniref:Aminodeoxychorismate lyase n=1 Tax=Natronospira bacteriovora TaxID=3069753 RepID=A0ABU0W5M0_9GAMM|nr:aminodeoxychorismate lyase [Natronospira sp. AB-CW4]MDQ2069257.1 aminodeoxychorismate lyase [Natronospira sp. AB-CW4]
MPYPEWGQWWVDGRPEPASADRGLQFGDGLFETMAVLDGQIRFLDRHLSRLARGCRVLGIHQPAPLQEDLLKLASGCTRAVIKLVVTAGVGGRGYSRPVTLAPRVHMARFPWPEGLPDALRIRVCEQRLSRQPALAGIKHCNRLEQVLARRELEGEDCEEGLLQDTADNVIEGVAANIFVVSDGRLRTPALDQAGVAGIMREWVLERSEAIGVPASESVLRLTDVMAADEVFMSNSLIGICPVLSLLGQEMTRSWSCGPVTQKLMGELSECR